MLSEITEGRLFSFQKKTWSLTEIINHGLNQFRFVVYAQYVIPNLKLPLQWNEGTGLRCVVLWLLSGKSSVFSFSYLKCFPRWLIL